MIQNYDKFSRWYAKFGKIYVHIEKFIFIQQQLTQSMWYIGETTRIFNKKLQKNSLKISFIWKSEKWLKRSHNYFVK
jgi:hypothetical protein